MNKIAVIPCFNEAKQIAKVVVGAKKYVDVNATEIEEEWTVLI